MRDACYPGIMKSPPGSFGRVAVPVEQLSVHVMQDCEQLSMHPVSQRGLQAARALSANVALPTPNPAARTAFRNLSSDMIPPDICSEPQARPQLAHAIEHQTNATTPTWRPARLRAGRRWLATDIRAAAIALSSSELNTWALPILRSTASGCRHFLRGSHPCASVRASYHLRQFIGRVNGLCVDSHELWTPAA